MPMLLAFFYIFYIEYQKNFTAAQPMKAEFKFDVLVPDNVNAYALVLTNEVISFRNDGQRLFDLI